MGAELLPRPGDVICGKYRIDAVVGAGGMGVVLGGVDISLGRPVAIKFLSPEKATREGAVARFLREARSAAAIQGEHVVRVFEVSTLPNGAPFIVMEHLRGADLSQILQQRGALPIEEACDYVLQACEALGEAHARGIVHRDLKPQNLFLTQRPDGSPCVKVLDFGISKVAVEDGAPNLTSTDTIMGTPLYMSPEQVRSLKNVDARADIWALGAILFELLTMSPIFHAPSASALCAMIAMDPPTPLRALRPHAPPGLEAAILRCLHKDPAGRFQDIAALSEALAPFASERGRQSATRISRVVRSASGQVSGGLLPIVAHAASPMAFHALEIASTVGSGPITVDTIRGSLPPSTRPGPISGGGPTYLPPGAPVPTTQSNWHQMHATGTAAQKNGSGALMAVLGVLTGLVLLGVIGSGAWYFVLRKDSTAAATSASIDSGTAGATNVTPSATATATTSASATPTSTSSVSPPSPKPTSTPTVKKDGGAPSPPSKDGGAPAPAPDDDAERNAALGRAAETQCANHRQQMTTFARDEASRKRAATQAKMFMCRGLSSSRCERQVCLEACLVLNDQPCIQQIKTVIDHGPAPKY